MGLRRARGLVCSVIAACLVGLWVGSTASGTVPGQDGKIIFEINDRGTVSLHTVHPGKAKPERFAPTAGSMYDPAYSPDGRSLAFIRNPGDQLWIHDGTLRSLTESDFSYVSEPTFSPNGRFLLYTKTYEGGKAWNGTTFVPTYPPTELWRVPVAGGTHELMRTWQPRDDWTQLFPAISPDGKTIAVTPYGDLTLLDGTGQSIDLIDLGDLTVYDVSFSPDGSRIAFTGVSTQGAQVYSVRLDGSDLVQLTEDPATWNTTPVYSPSGDYIAFNSSKVSPAGGPNQSDIYTMRTDGTRVEPLAVGPKYQYVGDWQRRAPFVVSGMKPRQRALRIRVFGRGRLIVSGTRIERRVTQVNAARTISLAIRPTLALKQLLTKRGRARTNVKVTFEPAGALPSTIQRKLVLKR